MDEMKLKSGLVFNKHTGAFSGFVDLGSSNRDMELAVSGGRDQDEPSAAPASRAGVCIPGKNCL